MFMRALFLYSIRLTIILILTFIFTTLEVTAQLNYQWVWLAGSNSLDEVGIHGTQGVAMASNIPGGRYDAAS